MPTRDAPRTHEVDPWRNMKNLGDYRGSSFMRLTGALSNSDPWKRLEQLAEIRQGSLARAEVLPHRPSVRVSKLRCGAVQDAVIAVLESAAEPMQAMDLRAAVEQVS